MEMSQSSLLEGMQCLTSLSLLLKVLCCWWYQTVSSEIPLHFWRICSVKVARAARFDIRKKLKLNLIAELTIEMAV